MASENAAITLRNRLYSHMQELPYAYHSKASTGDLVQRCTSDVDTVRRFLSFHLMNIVTTSLMVLIALLLMLPISVKVTLISLSVAPIIMVYSIVYFKQVLITFRAADEAEGQMSAVLQENLTGVRWSGPLARPRRKLSALMWSAASSGTSSWWASTWRPNTGAPAACWAPSRC